MIGLLAGSRTLWAAEGDPRVADIVAQTITVDMHNHWSAPGGDPAQGDGLAAAMRREVLSVVCLTHALDRFLIGGGDLCGAN